MGGGCFLTIRLSQPSLAGVRAGAELGNTTSSWHILTHTGVVLLLVISFRSQAIDYQLMRKSFR